MIDISDTADSEIIIDEATDPIVLARIHIHCFPEFYTTRMGLNFLREYYSIVLEYKYRIALVVKKNGKAVGFAVGFYNPGEFYKKLKMKRYKLFFLSFFNIIRDPALIWRSLANSRRVDSEEYDNRAIELSSIAVLPACKGLGSKLIQKFLEKASQVPHSVVLLTTDAIGNEKVNNFYIKNGFRLTKTYDDNGRLMNQYSIGPGE